MKKALQRLLGNKKIRVPRIFRINATPDEVSHSLYRGAPPPKSLRCQPSSYRQRGEPQ